jgi:hypothetical protein
VETVGHFWPGSPTRVHTVRAHVYTVGRVVQSARCFGSNTAAATAAAAAAAMPSLARLLFAALAAALAAAPLAHAAVPLKAAVSGGVPVPAAHQRTAAVPSSKGGIEGITAKESPAAAWAPAPAALLAGAVVAVAFAGAH